MVGSLAAAHIQTISAPARRWQHWWAARFLATQANNPVLKALRVGGAPRLLEFSITQQAAVERFEQHQAAACSWLHARRLLQRKGATVTQALLPFWLFDAVVSVQARGVPGFRSKGGGALGAGDMAWRGMTEWQEVAKEVQLSQDLPELQVYAAFKHPPSLVEAAKPAWTAAPAAGGVDDGGGAVMRSSRPLTEPEAEQLLHAGSGTPLQPADMSQAMAWHLAHRALSRAKMASAEAALRSAAGADAIKDVQVQLTVHSRTARLVYSPAYIAHYAHGTRYAPGSAGMIVPNLFYAAIGGAGAGRVCASSHYSSPKAQLLAAGALTGLAAAAGPLGAGLLNVGLVDTAFCAYVGATLAGMAAMQAPLLVRNQLVSQEEEARAAFMASYAQQEYAAQAGPNGGTLDEHTNWLWMDADWRRWESEPWKWNEAERAEAARNVWRQHNRRAAEQRAAMAAAARGAPWGEEPAGDASSSYQRSQQHQSRYRRSARQGGYAQDPYQRYQWEYGDGDGGGTRLGASGHQHAAAPGTRADFLGYYAALGLDSVVGSSLDEEVSLDTVKAAFKARALQLHPDKAPSGADQASLEAAKARFHKLQAAYETLRDPQKRAAYDRGQFTSA